MRPHVNRLDWRTKGVSAVLLLAVGGMVALSTPMFESETTPWIAPTRYWRKTNPVKSDDASLAVGAQVYAAQCEACHGKTGVGDGVRSGELDPPPGDLSKPEIWLQTDGELYYKVTKGRTPMPTFDKILTDDEMWHVVLFVRTLAPRPAVIGSRFDPGDGPRAAIGLAIAGALQFHDAAIRNDSAAMNRAAHDLALAADALKAIKLTQQEEAIANLWSSLTSMLASRAHALESTAPGASIQHALTDLSDAIATVLRTFGGVKTGQIYQFVLTSDDAAGDALSWFQSEPTPQCPVDGVSSGKAPIEYVFGPSTSTR